MAAKVVQDEKSTKKVVVVGGGLVRISRSVLGVFGNCALLNLVLVQPVTQSMHAFMGSASFTRLN